MRILCTSQVPLGIDGEALFELEPLAVADAVELFIRRASHRKHQALRRCRRSRCTTCAVRSTGCRWRSSWRRHERRRCRSRRSAAGSTTGSTCSATPPAAEPERRRALKATIGWSYELLFPDDQRGLWALATFAGGATLPAVEHVIEALDVPARTTIDVVGRLASRSLVHRRRRRCAGAVALSAARQHSCLRPRSHDRCRTDRVGPRRAREMVRRESPAAPPTECVVTGRPSTSRSPGASGQTSMPHSPGAPTTTLCSRCPSSTDSDGPGSSSATAVARSESWSRSMPPVMLLHLSDRATGLLLAAWLEASIGDLELARSHIDEAVGPGRRDR